MSTPEYTEYWRTKANNSPSNTPKQYTVNNLSSLNVTRSIDKLNISKNSKIMELGCNVGRNLHFLHSDGYTNLYGIEINSNAIIEGRDYYPELYKTLITYNGRCKNLLQTLREDYNVIYTMAVLLHMDDDERKIVYDYMEKHCKHVVAIEPNYIKETYIDRGRLFNKTDVIEQLKNRGFLLISKELAVSLKNNYDVIIMKKLVD